MKKLLALLMAFTTVFCFAGCEDGKCDECKSEKDVEVYEIDGEEKELCPSCAIEEGLGSIFGD